MENRWHLGWNGERQETYQIYVKLIGSGRPLRLTTEAASDISPAWSPDGTSIAFVRRDANKSKIMVIPALGGSERELMVQEQTVVPANYYPIRLSWSADGRWLLVSGIDYGTKSGSLWLVSSDGGEKRQLTHPPEGNVGDFEGAFSPDSRSVAFVRYTAMQAGDIYELSLTGNFTAKGEARRLTKDNRNLGGVAWTLDGRELIFSSDRGGTRALWRLSISGSAEPIRLSVGENGYSPAISRQGNRLVYSQTISDSNVWRLNLTDLREPPTELVASTRLETSAQYSPDGKKIAFESNRAGNQEVWMCDADGTNAVQLVTIGRSGSPRWSPDSQRIVFDSNVDGNWQIYTVSAHGGRPERMTKSSASDVRPSWSQDGKWLYFASNRTGGVKSWQIWKVPSGGGAAVQVTKNGGYGPFESKDGKTLYYLKSDASPSALMKVAAEGGEESPIIVQAGGSFVQARDGIYYYGQRSLEYLDFSTGKSKAIMPVERRMGLGLSLTPDERYLLFSRVDQGGSDLMLVENFR